MIATLHKAVQFALDGRTRAVFGHDLACNLTLRDTSVAQTTSDVCHV